MKTLYPDMWADVCHLTGFMTQTFEVIHNSALHQPWTKPLSPRFAIYDPGWLVEEFPGSKKWLTNTEVVQVGRKQDRDFYGGPVYAHILDCFQPPLDKAMIDGGFCEWQLCPALQMMDRYAAFDPGQGPLGESKGVKLVMDRRS